MSILCNAETRLIVQGMTGRSGTFYTDQAITYGTNVVGGVRPGKGGKTHIGRPVFNTVREAMAETGADATMVMVPAHNAAEAMIEAVEAEMPLIVCVTERIPVLDMIRVKDALSGSVSELVGPNSQGVLTPGACKIGVMSTADARPGTIGIASRSASLTSEVVAGLSAVGLGQSTTVGVGGDPVHGIGFQRCLELFMADPGTTGIVLVGEIGGSAEEEAAQFLIDEAKKGRKKPMVGFIAGRTAPKGRTMGHAGAIVSGGQGDAESKIAAMEEAGIRVSPSPARLGTTMVDVLKG